MNNVNNNKRRIEESPASSSKKIRRITPIKISGTDPLTAKSNGASTLNASQDLLVPFNLVVVLISILSMRGK